ncbi:unnamed protein product, partial [Effrenium voratum]
FGLEGCQRKGLADRPWPARTMNQGYARIVAREGGGEVQSSATSLHKRVDAKSVTSCARVAFRWNGRDCSGFPIHEAALHGDHERVNQLHEEHPELLNTRFTYQTRSPEGNVQEGSGEAIHLAASRGHEEVVRLLVSLGARVEDKVTRGNTPHYDVLHAAVYAEGKGGSTAMVGYLLHVKANPNLPNQDGRTALHLAYQTGNVPLIHRLHEAIDDWGTFEDAIVEGGHPLPLEIGIHFDKMSEDELSESARLTARSLQIFIDHLPHCIPNFLLRSLQNEEDMAESGMDPKSIAQLIETEDIASLMRECPDAACALLDYCSLRPEVTSGHNPLPTRVSFAPRTWTQSLQQSLNMQNELMVFYKPDQVWDYNDTTFEMPPWQKQITEDHEDRLRDRRRWEKRRRRMTRKDAEIKICHVPNLLTAEYFQALVDASDTDPAFTRFENEVVRATIHYAFWHGAVIYDVLQVAMSFWAVLILVFETGMLQLEYLQLEGGVSQEDARMLRSKGHGGNLVAEVPSSDDGCLLCNLHVATSWIAAKGLVDLSMEVIQFLGCCTIGQPGSYLTFGNAFDIARAVAAQMLFWHPESKLVHVVVIFCLWLRLLEIFTSAEKVARAVLPVRDLAKGLVPALVVFGVGYCAFVHAFFAVKDTTQPVWTQVFHSSFSSLITAEIPADVNKAPFVEMSLEYLAVLMFSIFFLNIFIGVIGELYQIEKERSELTFQELRAQSVLTFNLRALIMPGAVCNASLAQAITVVTLCIIAGTQLCIIFTRTRIPFLSVIYTFLQTVMVACVFQCPDEVWGGARGTENRYLWMCVPASRREEDVRAVVMEELPDPAPAMQLASSRKQWSTDSVGSTVKSMRSVKSRRFAVSSKWLQRQLRRGAK